MKQIIKNIGITGLAGGAALALIGAAVYVFILVFDLLGVSFFSFLSLGMLGWLPDHCIPAWLAAVPLKAAIPLSVICLCPILNCLGSLLKLPFSVINTFRPPSSPLGKSFTDRISDEVYFVNIVSAEFFLATVCGVFGAFLWVAAYWMVSFVPDVDFLISCGVAAVALIVVLAAAGVSLLALVALADVVKAFCKHDETECQLVELFRI